MTKSYYPKTLEEAVDAIDKEDIRIVAGGTDFMLDQREEENLLFTGMIPEIKGIKRSKNHLTIGAGVNLTDLINLSEEPFIEDIAKSIGSPAVRNWATVGGNLCNASPIGDLLPMIYALDGIIGLKSKDNERKIPIERFILGRKNTALTEGEIMVDVNLTLPKTEYNYLWVKVAGRNSNALSKVSFFTVYTHNKSKIKDIRIAIGGLAPVVIRRREVEKKIIEALNIDESFDIFHKIFIEYQQLFSPIDDQRSTSQYKLITIKKIFLNLMEDLIHKQRSF